MRELLEGKALEHFQLLEYVGGGGMGAVFRALDTSLCRTVAIKVLAGNRNFNGDLVKRFKNEALSAARLTHDNIARVYHVGAHEGWNFIVFEYIEGINIRDRVLRHGVMPIAQGVDCIIQVAEALRHASAQNVVHRDIKPSNILITPDGRIKLVDMGLARIDTVRSGEDELTESGVTLGTFDYISPEQAGDPRAADVRSDIYSLGCTFYFMLTGRPPFPAGTALQKLLSHSRDIPTDVRSLRPDLPVSLAKVIERMMAKDPHHRYQTPAELISDLAPADRAVSKKLTRHTGTDVWRWIPALPWIVAATLLPLVVYWAHEQMYTCSPSTPARQADSSLPAPRLPLTEPTSDRTDSTIDASNLPRP